MLEVAPTEDDVIRHCERTGRPLPAAIAEAPALQPGLEPYLQGFQALCHDRPIGMGLGSIPWMAVQHYCAVCGFDSEQSEAMHHHCRALDTVWLNHHNRRTADG